MDIKQTILTLTFFLVLSSISAQDYSTGIGLRGGPSSGITIKQFIGGKSALEGIFATRWKGFNITALYEIHKSVFAVPKLNWYYGIGGHIGFWDGYVNHPWFTQPKSYRVIGADFILGIEYNFTELPINLSLDWKPAFNILGNVNFWGDEGALSLRYIF